MPLHDDGIIHPANFTGEHMQEFYGVLLKGGTAEIKEDPFLV